MPFRVELVLGMTRAQVALGTVLDKIEWYQQSVDPVYPTIFISAVPRGVIPYPSIIMNNNNVGLTFLEGIRYY